MRLPLSNYPPIILNSKKSDRLAIGDEVLVRVSREAIKQKLPSVSSDILLTGKLVIVRYGGGGLVGVSKKVPFDEKMQDMKNRLQQYLPEGFGAILRTNSYESTFDDVLAEYESLLDQLTWILEHAKYHKVFSCLYREQTIWKRMMDDYNNNSLTKIITDLPYVRDELLKALPVKDQGKITYYDAHIQPLYAMYRLNRDMKEARNKQVWLKSGAYLVIEQTEAMVVIDVNTGKAVDKKNREENFYKVNLEAAAEIARQLRIRNLSGIIMIDFIDMESGDHEKELLKHLSNELKKDRIKVNVIDMTKLKLVELTRKKVQKSLEEQFAADNNY